MPEVWEMTQPDVEKWVWDLLGPLGGLHSETIDTQHPDGPVGWMRRETVQVDARSSSKTAARAKIMQAFQALLAQQDSVKSDGVWGAVEVVAGPLWQPEPDGQPRYVLRVNIYAHPLGGP